jgi:hypothetical protein
MLSSHLSSNKFGKIVFLAAAPERWVDSINKRMPLWAFPHVKNEFQISKDLYGTNHEIKTFKLGETRRIFEMEKSD